MISDGSWFAFALIMICGRLSRWSNRIVSFGEEKCVTGIGRINIRVDMSRRIWEENAWLERLSFIKKEIIHSFIKNV